METFSLAKEEQSEGLQTLALEDSVIRELYKNSQATGGVVMGSLDKNTMMNITAGRVT